MANYIQYIPQVNSTTYPVSISNCFTALTSDVTDLETEITNARNGEANLLDSINLKLNLSGGTLTGSLTLSAGTVVIGADDVAVKDAALTDGIIISADASGRVTTASGIVVANVVERSGTLTNGEVAVVTTGNDIQTTGIVAANIATLSGAQTISGNKTFSGTVNLTSIFQIGGVAITSSAAELNVLDGITSNVSELNILDGVTSTTSELNILDGVTANATELNIMDGITPTTIELNYVNGVTSAIQTQLNQAVINLKSVTATTSGTTINYTSIPSYTKRITIMFSGVSINATDNLSIILGDSGGLETSGYLGGAINIASGVSTQNTTSYIVTTSITSSATINSTVVINLLDPSTNTWVMSGSLQDNQGTPDFFSSGGTKSLSSTLTQLRIHAYSGASFNAGKVNIIYE